MKAIISIICLFLIPGAFVSLLGAIEILSGNTGILYPLLSGFSIGLLLYLLLFRKWNWLATFIHELSHALVALFFWRRITAFVVKGKQGGYIKHTGGFGGKTGDFFILLAPYYLPAFFAVSVFCRPLLPGNWFPWFDVFVGFVFACHLIGNMNEIKLNWTKNRFKNVRGDKVKTDIGKAGYIFAAITITALTLLIYSILFTVLAKGFGGVPVVFETIYKQGVSTVTGIYETCEKLISYFLS